MAIYLVAVLLARLLQLVQLLGGDGRGKLTKKDDVHEVKDGFEFGIRVENFNDIKVGDVIECYRTEEVARSLESSAST